ncbi:right-handed parallel beta-helix repeat-containing protein [Brevundimonas subvibrioides]|uniref:Right handed beta helix domain-containing protein n=1 Tax=Brevundimonas subvibrioides (strain ATCC 15264 / DSM 4735 / LMG 14903 / NBRC 16000 / CB 81) TaxID=633149 RepID=D9QG21_BRESC|nr:right-handed parallel beta-helix repeat-containing protein [Brevundimonas subvibrioides]ADL02563.1 conserved hypothetical protein [Brevundimonas subvibrioides ATCC 15264]
MDQIAPPVVEARACTGDEIAALTSDAPAPIVLACRATLTAGQTVKSRVVFEGAASAGAGIACNGAQIGRPGVASSVDAPTVLIQSVSTPTGWSRPTDVTLRDCIVHGNIRVRGLGAGGDLEPIRASSRTADHTATTQAAAPTRIRLTNLTLVATGSIPLYVGPGVTDLTFEASRVSGRSVSTAVYLDAESAGNVIRGVTFSIRTGREQIAVDGAARNRIEHNTFALGGRGGVFLYRNCGEDGVIRHQTPSDNVITGNTFTGVRWLWPNAVVVGSREGRRRYCAADTGWAFGSSVDDADHAERNVVERNVIRFGWRPF